MDLILSESEKMEEFTMDLSKTFEDLKRLSGMLYSVRHIRADAFRFARDLNKALEPFPEVHTTCQALWESAEDAQKEAVDLDLTQTCIGFFVSECWLEEPVIGDSSTLCGPWDSSNDCLEAVRKVFKKSSELKQNELAKQIFSTRRACDEYFEQQTIAAEGSKMSDEGTILDEQVILDIHSILTGGVEKSSFRTTPSTNDLGMMYLDATLIKDYLAALLDFVKCEAKKTSSLKDRLLLSVLFFERFLWVHPFGEGNGRTARLLMSLILCPYVKTLPLPLFLRAVANPRDFYIHSIRANPRKPPVCLAYYVLSCLVENVNRILSVPRRLNVPLHEVELDEDERSVWTTISRSYPSVTEKNVQWMNKKRGFLVVTGKSYASEVYAKVHEVSSVEEARGWLRREAEPKCKVFSYYEFFARNNNTLLCESLSAHSQPFSPLSYISVLPSRS